MYQTCLQYRRESHASSIHQWMWWGENYHKLLPDWSKKNDLTFHEDLPSIQYGLDISRPTLEHCYIYDKREDELWPLSELWSTHVVISGNIMSYFSRNVWVWSHVWLSQAKTWSTTTTFFPSWSRVHACYVLHSSELRQCFEMRELNRALDRASFKVGSVTAIDWVTWEYISSPRPAVQTFRAADVFRHHGVCQFCRYINRVQCLFPDLSRLTLSSSNRHSEVTST